MQALLPRFEQSLKDCDGTFDIMDNWAPFFRLGAQIPSSKAARRDGQKTEYVELFKLPGKFPLPLRGHLRLMIVDSITGVETPYPKIRTAQSLSSDTSGDNHLQQALKWLNECLSKHNRCNPSKDTNGELPRLPKRIIDVTPLDDAGSVTLVETTDERDTYLCLSHCWGQSRPCITTRSNIAVHKDKIEWASLPKTFQDAIDFVRRLGQRYLWIDSLCILQVRLPALPAFTS